MIIHREFNSETFKISVIERGDGKFLATFWDKDLTEEADRDVRFFETYGGAVDQAFEWACAELRLFCITDPTPEYNRSSGTGFQASGLVHDLNREFI